MGNLSSSILENALQMPQDKVNSSEFSVEINKQDSSKQELYRLLKAEMDKNTSEEVVSEEDRSGATPSSIAGLIGVGQTSQTSDKAITDMLEAGEFSKRCSGAVYNPKKKFLKEYQSNVESNDVIENVVTSTPVGVADSSFPQISPNAGIQQTAAVGNKFADDVKTSNMKALNISSCIEAIVESELKKYELNNDDHPKTQQDSWPKPQHDDRLKPQHVIDTPRDNFPSSEANRLPPFADMTAESWGIKNYLRQKMSPNVESQFAKNYVPARNTMTARQPGRMSDERTERMERIPAANVFPNQTYQSYGDDKYRSPAVESRIPTSRASVPPGDLVPVDEYQTRRGSVGNWQMSQMAPPQHQSPRVQALLTAQSTSASVMGFYGDARRKVEPVQQEHLMKYGRTDQGQGYSPPTVTYSTATGDQRHVMYQRNIQEPPKPTEAGRLPYFTQAKSSYVDQSDFLGARKVETSYYMSRSPQVEAGRLVPVEPNVQPLVTGLSQVAAYPTQSRDGNYGFKVERPPEIIIDRTNIPMQHLEAAYDMEIERRKNAAARESMVNEARGRLSTGPDVHAAADNIARSRSFSYNNRSREFPGPERHSISEETAMDLSIKKNDGIDMYRTLAVNPYVGMHEIRDSRKSEYQQNIFYGEHQGSSNARMPRPGLLPIVHATSSAHSAEVPRRDTMESMYHNASVKSNVEENTGMRSRPNVYEQQRRHVEESVQPHYSSNPERWSEPASRTHLQPPGWTTQQTGYISRGGISHPSNAPETKQLLEMSKKKKVPTATLR